MWQSRPRLLRSRYAVTGSFDTSGSVFDFMLRLGNSRDSREDWVGKPFHRVSVRRQVGSITDRAKLKKCKTAVSPSPAWHSPHGVVQRVVVVRCNPLWYLRQRVFPVRRPCLERRPFEPWQFRTSWRCRPTFSFWLCVLVRIHRRTNCISQKSIGRI